MLDLTLAIAHHLLVFALFGILFAEFMMVRRGMEPAVVAKVAPSLGDKMTVRLPSGVERAGTVFYRGADAGFATQRDVSRTKRDIKTFEIRLRVDNSDRRLAVGMTAYILMPVE